MKRKHKRHNKQNHQQGEHHHTNQNQHQQQIQEWTKKLEEIDKTTTLPTFTTKNGITSIQRERRTQ